VRPFIAAVLAFLRGDSAVDAFGRGGLVKDDGMRYYGNRLLVGAGKSRACTLSQGTSSCQGKEGPTQCLLMHSYTSERIEFLATLMKGRRNNGR